MTYEFKIKVTVSGNATEQEVKDFIAFEVGAHGSISQQNPFIDEDGTAEIEDVDIETVYF